MLDGCSTELLSKRLSVTKDWISAWDAMVLLTYSAYNIGNRPLIEEIQKRTHLELPVGLGKSKFEDAFAVDLKALLRDMREPSGGFHDMERQVFFNDGRYRVDFLVTLKQVMPGGKLVVRKQFVIEYDEPDHNRTKRQLEDADRDAWFRENLPEIHLIRVKQEDHDEWLEMMAKTHGLATLKECEAHSLWVAFSNPDRGDLVITSESSKAAYDPAKNRCHFLLNRPTQRLRELRELAERLGIPYEDKRSIHFKRENLPLKRL